VLNSNSKTNFNLSGTLTVAGNTTLSGGTANGVAYLNASKVLTTGSALTWDGSTFYVKPTGAQFVTGATFAKIENLTGASASFIMADTTDSATIKNVASSMAFINSTTEGMRLTSTGLGIGTSSPVSKLHVVGAQTIVQNITPSFALWADSTPTKAGRMIFNNALANGLELGVYNGTAWNSALTISQTGNVTINAPSSGTALSISANGVSQNALGFVDTNGAGRTFVTGPGIGTGAVGDFGFYDSTASQLASLYTGGASGKWAWYTVGAERMRLDSSGNLVLGNSSAAAFLDINGGISASSAAPAARFVRNNGGNAYSNLTGLQIYWNHSNGDQESNIVYGGASTSYITFTRNNAGTFTETARIDSSGNLLVGTTTNSYTATNGFVVNGPSGGTYAAVCHPTGTGSGASYVIFSYNGALIGNITQSGTTAVLYNTTSDRRLKDNITDADSASDLIDAIKVRQFDWKSDGNHQRYGMIAQELHEVAPEAVHSPADPDDMMAVDYSKLVPMLVKEIQSLRVRLNALENK
jgi:hypothetical protein